MVIAKIKHGLGNQLFQYAAGRSLARRRGVPLLLDASEFSATSFRQYGLDQFMAEPAHLGPHARYWLGRLRKNWLKPMRAAAERGGFIRIAEDASRGFEAMPPSPARIVYLDGYWQSELYFAADRELLLHELTLRAPAPPAAQALQAEMHAAVSVCVHVRRGDYVSLAEGHRHWVICAVEYYQAAMRYIAARAPRAKFYFFSDDPAWVQSHFPPAADRVLVSGAPARSDVEDFRLMTGCRHFIIANSTFSWWAAWLGRAPDKIVVAPQQWYRTDKFSDKDLIPARWVRL